MSENQDLKEFYNVADKFINLANELSQKDTSGSVGSALRYAAARFSAFEASMVSKDLGAEKDEIKKSFMIDYEHMLEENLQVYLHHLAMKSVEK